jgi:hypothetical protein
VPIGEMRNACKILIGKPEGKKQLGRPRCICEDNIKIDFMEIGLKDVNWDIWFRIGTIFGLL